MVVGKGTSDEHHNNQSQGSFIPKKLEGNV
jgi:hypothetical protein